MLGDEPGRDCPICSRLVAFRNDNRRAEPTWHNAPVPSFGDAAGRLLVVGLAPGVKGANRTGRPFTGDYAGDLLYATLLATGFARGTYDRRPDDGLELVDCVITNGVRCVPPQNKPTPAEIAGCRPFLTALLSAMPHLASIVALGRIAHETLLRALGVKLAAAPFGHARQHAVARPDGRLITLFDSYHCSRYNTSTRVLTEAMFHDVFAAVRGHLDDG